MCWLRLSIIQLKLQVRIMKDKSRILAIEAHPDDLVYFYGGYIAKMVDEGHEIRVITLTTGDQSTVDPTLPRERIEAIMREEHDEAMNIIGITDQKYLEGFTNHFIFSAEQKLRLREILIQEIRKFKPDTVITFDIADIFEENPDHRVLAQIGMQAAAFAAYPLVHPEHKNYGLEPHFVGRMLLAPTRNPNVFVDISEEPLERKKKAGAAYASQLDLMITELEKRLITMGLNPDLDDISNDDLWDTICESMAEETAQEAMEFYSRNVELAPKVPMQFAEAFRMQYLGSVEKVRDMLPKECLVL